MTRTRLRASRRALQSSNPTGPHSCNVGCAAHDVEKGGHGAPFAAGGSIVSQVAAVGNGTVLVAGIGLVCGRGSARWHRNRGAAGLEWSGAASGARPVLAVRKMVAAWPDTVDGTLFWSVLARRSIEARPLSLLGVRHRGPGPGRFRGRVEGPFGWPNVRPEGWGDREGWPTDPGSGRSRWLASPPK